MAGWKSQTFQLFKACVSQPAMFVTNGVGEQFSIMPCVSLQNVQLSLLHHQVSPSNCLALEPVVWRIANSWSQPVKRAKPQWVVFFLQELPLLEFHRFSELPLEWTLVWVDILFKTRTSFLYKQTDVPLTHDFRDTGHFRVLFNREMQHPWFLSNFMTLSEI